MLRASSFYDFEQSKGREMSLFKIKRFFRRAMRNSKEYRADGMRVRNKNFGFLVEEEFSAAWATMLSGEHGPRRAEKFFNGNVPDIRWRAHINCWAAATASRLEGDFVELGTATGIQAGTICAFLDFAKQKRNFFLFDTFAGIPEIDGMTDAEKSYARSSNSTFYFDCFEAVSQNFKKYDNVKITRGILPEALNTVAIEKIAYMHIDLNNAAAEIKSFEILFPKVVPGAIVILDDYAFAGHENQYLRWNNFLKDKKIQIATLPTGQGIFIKT